MTNQRASANGEVFSKAYEPKTYAYPPPWSAGVQNTRKNIEPRDGIETMANQSATLTQAALTRILKAHRDAGIPVVRTEIGRDGKVVVYSTERDQDSTANPWDAA